VKRGLQSAAIGLVLFAASIAQSQTPSTIPAGTEVLIGAPKKIPEGLLDSFKDRLAKTPSVAEAYLALILVKGQGGEPHLLLFIRIDDVPSFTKDLIRNDLGGASGAFLGQGESIDILTEETPPVTSAVRQAVKPFYVRSQ